MAWVKDGWEVTPFLRWHKGTKTIEHPPYYEDGVWKRKVSKEKILQQLWVETDTHYFDSNRLSEWRDVPMEDE